MGVTSGSSVLKFTLKELEELVNDADSQVYLKKDVKYPLKLTPACLQNVNQAITEILTAERLKYIPKYKGLLLAYKHVRRHSNMGTINDDECNILIHIHVDLYIFAPEIGCTMTGIVSKISEDNIGCLVHKGFNVTLPRPRNEGSTKWIGNAVKLGDEVKFKLDLFNVVGTLPYIRGVLLSHKTVKRESGLMDFLGDSDLPLKKKKSAIEKGKKHALKVEDTASELLKKPSKKKKKHAEADDEANFMEETLPTPVKGKKERKTSEKSESAVVAPSDTFSAKKSKKDKKRKNDPIADPAIELEPQISAKKRMKLSSTSSGDAGSSALDGGRKSSLLQFLHSDDEGDDNQVGSQAETMKTTDKNKKRKSKSPTKPTVKQDTSTQDVGDMSIEALMQQALVNVSGKTPKPKKSRPLHVPDEALIPKESPRKSRPENEAVIEPTSVKKKKLTPENLVEDKTGSLAQELSKSAKKKTKSKLSKFLDSDDANSEMSSEPRTSGLSDFVVPKPEDLLAKIQDTKSPIKKLKSKPNKPLNNFETIGTTSKFAENSETSFTKKKGHRLSLSDNLDEDDTMPKPEELLAKMLEQQAKSSKKKKTKTNTIDPSLNGGVDQTPSKSDTSSPKKSKGKKALSMDEDDDDFNIPSAAEILAKVQKEQQKSPKKKGKTNLSDLLDSKNLPTPSKAAAKSETSSPKKGKGKKALSMDEDEDFNIPTAAEILAKVQEEKLKSPKKKGKTNLGDFSDSKDILPTPSKVVAFSETLSAKKKRKSKSGLLDFSDDYDTVQKQAELLAQEELTKSSKKKKKSKPTELSESGETVQTPEKSAANPESSSSKRTSKSILMGLLTEPRGSMSERKTPAKIRKAFVQSPIFDVAKTSKTPKVKKAPASAAQTPLPRKEGKAGSKQGTPVKKLGKTEEGTLSLLDKLLSQEKSLQLDANESPALKHSSKKKSKK